MSTPQDSALGRHVDYPREYDPSLLFPIARSLGRTAIGIVTLARVWGRVADPAEGIPHLILLRLLYPEERASEESYLRRPRLIPSTPSKR